ncbi:MAG: DUF4931 domain-containing protein [Calditrichaeota bacterium]|nr:MAG: DUF4931 domain-containing protein [Calditrichota bacterium]MBL1205465.1 DUF4931 domain-containing protein [Calditrichota bacterium]NOG45294.1 DUF4931 domain-containing protein [Calditrichota bacterium]
MSEIRLDPVDNDAVVISPERNKRPKDNWDKSEKDITKCPFCPGNENLTPAENFSLKDDLKNWTIRSFPNKYPAFTDSSNHISGIQEVIVESVNHDLNMGEYSKVHLTDLLYTYKQRIAELKQQKSVKYVVVFKNHGVHAGASLAHPHSQIVGLGFIPQELKNKIERLERLYHKNKKCYYCGLAETSNIIYENDSFISFIPETAKYSYQSWIIPKEHFSYYEKTPSAMLGELADVILKILKSINRFLDCPPLNLIINSGFDVKANPYFHWNIQIIPRTAQLAGFEMATGCYINQVKPEQAAAHLKKLI